MGSHEGYREEKGFTITLSVPPEHTATWRTFEAVAETRSTSPARLLLEVMQDWLAWSE